MASKKQKSTQSRPRARVAFLAWVLGAVILLLGVLDVVLILGNLDLFPLDEDWGFRGFQAALAFPLAPIGSLIAARRPRNPIGWLFLAAAGLGLASEVTGEYVYLAAGSSPADFPAVEFAAWLSVWVWVPGTAAFLIYSFLYFPNGRLVSPIWRWAVRLSTVLVSATVLVITLVPGIVHPAGIQNPVAWQALAPIQDTVLILAQLFLFFPALLALASLVLRFRRSAGAERQQMKWFVLAAAIAPFATVLGSFSGMWANLALFLVVITIPAAMAVAILRYRLYSIDIIINRTLVYGVLTGALAGIYFGSVLILQRVLPAQSQLAVVVSTLAVAALFSPLRRRIQTTIDRRFFRQKYDSVQTIAVFSQILRQEVDLGRLSTTLIQTVQDTVQPATASIWLKEPGSLEDRYD